MVDKNEIESTVDYSQNKYDTYKYLDPYSDTIQTALLNGYDIHKYIDKCGIISPYLPENMLSATYKVPLYGDVYSWDDSKSEMIHVPIPRDNPENFIILKKNSITYFHIDTVFRVPYYMVFRFNLTVSLAHKGLLLGTGPVVDPGFQGRILIPVHNLTGNDYRLDPGSGLIRVEFTKLSEHDIFKGLEASEKYAYNLGDFKTDAFSYFKEINQNKPIVSSIPEESERAMTIALTAQKEAQSSLGKVDSILNDIEEVETTTQNKIKNMQVGGAISIVIGLAATIIPTWSLINDTYNVRKDIIENVTKELQTEADTNKSTIKYEEIEALKQLVYKQQSTIDSLQKSIIKIKAYSIKETCHDTYRDMRGDCIRQNDPCLTPTTK